MDIGSFVDNTTKLTTDHYFCVNEKEGGRKGGGGDRHLVLTRFD